jgi:HD-like signal output (HDOD) protein/prolyl-tRNA editing enzyme YbaK/EbsC (Cys-tRNA(Pro) deacylase)
MSIPAKVRDYLRRRGGAYRARVCREADSLAETVAGAGLSPAQVARATVLKGGSAYLMVVHPCDRQVDIGAVGRLFRLSVEPVSRDELESCFPDCDWRALPPVPAAYGLRAVLDPRLEQADEVYLPLGRLGAFARTDGRNFGRLLGGAWRRGDAFRRTGEEVAAVDSGAGWACGAALQMERSVEGRDGFWPMPGIAGQVLSLRDNPYAHVSELAAIIEQDPVLSDQIVRYSAFPFHGYRGKVETVSEAVGRVLGMDFALELAFGLSLARSQRNLSTDPASVRAFWRHALYGAALAHALCNEIEYLRRPSHEIEYLRRPSPGTAFLGALLHNVAALATQFRGPEQPVPVPGWEMPVEIAQTIAAHDNPEYDGDYAVYPRLAYIANALLRRWGIGEPGVQEPPVELLEKVGLTPGRAEAALEAISACRDGLDSMASMMAE